MFSVLFCAERFRISSLVNHFYRPEICFQKMSSKLQHRVSFSCDEPRRHKFGRLEKPKRKNASFYKSVSKKLAYILRHGALKKNLKIHEGGFISVDELLKLREFRDIQVEDIYKIVSENDKQRFHLEYQVPKENEIKKRDPPTSKILMICANQGHSMEIDLKNSLKPILNAEKYQCVVHGTTLNAWRQIENEGLKRMNRVHIHFAIGLPGNQNVISGMRNSSEVLIFLDLKNALQSGIKFFESRNNVILSEGDKNGIIKPIFFKEVIHRQTRQNLKRNSSFQNEKSGSMKDEDNLSEIEEAQTMEKVDYSDSRKAGKESHLDSEEKRKDLKIKKKKKKYKRKHKKRKREKM